MRRRISRALLATAAAGATVTTLGFAAAGSAGAATVAPRPTAPHKAGDPPSAPVMYTNANCALATAGSPAPTDNCGRAGYQASGRTFRYAQALIAVPPTTVDGTTVTNSPQIYVALDDSNGSTSYTFARAGVARCATTPPNAMVPTCPTTTPATPDNSWVAYVQMARTGSPNLSTVAALPIVGSTQGDRVFASLYLDPSGQVVHAQIRLPSGATYHYALGFPGATFRWAQAQADWTAARAAGGTGLLPNFSTTVKTRITQFFQGGFTTTSGQRGTFSGPWTLSAPEVTTNGTAAGTLVAEPSYLWNDGLGMGWGDAFGVWNYPF